MAVTDILTSTLALTFFLSISLPYESSTVNHWLQSGLLRSVSAHSEALIAKKWLIDFLCEYGYRITRKTENHLKLMPPS